MLNRALVNNGVLIAGTGSPCTVWHNNAVDAFGISPKTATKCYCWDDQKGSPDRKHFLCGGNGYLPGWDKYGYKEIIFSTPHTCTKTTNIVKTGTRGSAYSISGLSLTESITTERYTLDNFITVDYLLLNDTSDSNINRITYQYSVDDINWITLVTTTYTTSPVANKIATLVLPEGTEYIRFKIILLKKTTSSQSPTFNSLRFRYRNKKLLSEIDTRYSTVTIPAFLASRQPVTERIAGGKEGWITEYPLQWWVLPDTNIENYDVIMFLFGEFENVKFEVQGLMRYVYGKELQLLHKGFESKYIRDNNDLLGIVQYLL